MRIAPARSCAPTSASCAWRREVPPYSLSMTADGETATGALVWIERPGLQHAEALVPMLRATYWWDDDAPAAQIVAAHQNASAWVVAMADGALVGSARAITDGVRHGVLLDVIVAPPRCGQGIGTAILGRLFSLPAVRDVERFELRTKDAQSLYARFGFEAVEPRYPAMFRWRTPT